MVWVIALLTVGMTSIVGLLIARHQRHMGARERLTSSMQVDEVIKHLGALQNELQQRANSSVENRELEICTDRDWVPNHLWAEWGGYEVWEKSIAQVRLAHLATREEIDAFNMFTVNVLTSIDLHDEEEIRRAGDAIAEATTAFKSVRRRSLEKLAPNGTRRFRAGKRWRWLRRRTRIMRRSRMGRRGPPTR